MEKVEKQINKQIKYVIILSEKYLTFKYCVSHL